MSVILIAGPTASGKSGLALAIAEKTEGVIINADASQVYDCWRGLSARPSDADCTAAPHRLYGHVAAQVRYSTGRWLRDVAAVLADARAAGKRPIVVGGTGLYFQALTTGLADIPPVPTAVHAQSQAMLDAGALDALVADLAARDPATLAGIDARNPMRVQRAWNVLTATGRGLAAWQSDTPPPLVDPQASTRIVLLPETGWLNQRIALRFAQMMADGALDEVRRFLAVGVDPGLPAARVLGAPQLGAHLRGECALDAAVAASITATRQFAKRQRTWFRNKMTDWTAVDPAGGPRAALDQVAVRSA